MEGDGADSDSGPDEALLRLVAGRLGELTLIERVSVLPVVAVDGSGTNLDLTALVTPVRSSVDYTRGQAEDHYR